jgi:hypothetical protein
MKILFLHGWHSTPGGLKPTYLKDHGHEVLNPALPDDDFYAAVRIAQAEFEEHHPNVIVGSSRGGAAAMNIDSGSTPLVLLCPAWKRWGTAKLVITRTVILHSKADETIPFADSQELWRNSHLPSGSLIEVGTEHRLADEDSLKAMLAAIDRLTTPEPQVITPEYGVPRQFGVGALLLITAMYAVLFAILRASRSSPSEYLGIGLFFFAIGLGQMFLFEGQRPRRASVIVGACFPVVCWIIGYLLGDLDGLDFGRAIFGTMSGAFYGYLAGVIISGLFLFADKAKRLHRRPKPSDKADEPRS